MDSDQAVDVKVEIEKLLKKASKNGLPSDALQTLQNHVCANVNVFRSSFSAGPSSKVILLNVDHTTDAGPVRVRLRNCSQEQRMFLSTFVKMLVQEE